MWNLNGTQVTASIMMCPISAQLSRAQHSTLMSISFSLHPLFYSGLFCVSTCRWNPNMTFDALDFDLNIFALPFDYILCWFMVNDIRMDVCFLCSRLCMCVCELQHLHSLLCVDDARVGWLKPSIFHRMVKSQILIRQNLRVDVFLHTQNFRLYMWIINIRTKYTKWFDFNLMRSQFSDIDGLLSGYIEIAKTHSWVYVCVQQRTKSDSVKNRM